MAPAALESEFQVSGVSALGGATARRVRWARRRPDGEYHWEWRPDVSRRPGCFPDEPPLLKPEGHPGLSPLQGTQAGQLRVGDWGLDPHPKPASGH